MHAGRLALLLLLLLAAGHSMAAAEEKPPKRGDGSLSARESGALFVAQIKPLLKRKCLGCHGEGEELEGELDLRSRRALLAGGASGQPALTPGQPEKSLLYAAVAWQDPDLKMPPKERNRLSAKEVALVRQWIAAGAVWPDAAPQDHGKQPASSKGESDEDGMLIATSGGLSPEWTNRRYRPGDVWAYQPIQRYAPPDDGLDSARIANSIDAFIQQRLKQRGFEPAPAADKLTLIRRLSIGLTGLPPSPEETKAFLDDESPRAYDDLVARLLNSRHYGEQSARHWLDVVRYADTGGFSNDYERPNAWRYRDYVVRSFNNDKPYDRFIVEQIAGDELDANQPELLIAAGFLRMGPWEHTGMSVAAVTRQQFLDDVTNAVGVTFLGQGLRCAKCHDHKFDPVPTKDYYRVQAGFAPVQFAERRVPYQPWENVASFDAGRKRTGRLLGEAKAFLASLTQKHQAAVAKLLKERRVKKLSDLPSEERPRRHYGLTPLDMSLQKIFNKRVHYFQREMRRYEPLALSVYSGPPNGYNSNRPLYGMPPLSERRGEVESVRILRGGSLEAPGDEVSPGVVSALHGSNEGLRRTAWNSIPGSTHGRRLALARWIASPGNPLTARVIVNRVWQQHFGRGLVDTPNNLGKMGGRPSHPKLLDWLATWFIEHGWSVKRLHRLIVSSHTYRQSGNHPQAARLREMDSSNKLLAYYPPRRLAAEELRDAMLAISGELNRERGGPGVFPEINWEVATQPRHIMGSVAPAYQPSRLPRQRNRRTIYAFRYRTLADPMLEVFNRPGSDTSCPRRDETTVTPQAFALFNGQFAHDRALALARRIEDSSKQPDERIRLAFRLVYGRVPGDAELNLCRQHVAEMTRHHRAHQPRPIQPPTKVVRRMVEELTGEEFQWEESLDEMKHYQGDLKPWDVGPATRGLAELCLVLLNSNEFLYVR